MKLTNRHILVLKTVIHLTALSYLGVYYYWALTDNLTADPVKAIIHFTGMGAINLLLLTLLVTPLAKILKQGQLMRVRRLLGLYSFTYVVMHMANYIMFDLQLQFDTLFEDIVKRPYITVGFVGFIILLSLAITSTTAMQRRLRHKWQKLHKLIYPTILLACLHFIWAVKSLDPEPIIYFLLAFALLAFRHKPIQRKLLKK